MRMNPVHNKKVKRSNVHVAQSHEVPKRLPECTLSSAWSTGLGDVMTYAVNKKVMCWCSKDCTGCRRMLHASWSSWCHCQGMRHTENTKDMQRLEPGANWHSQLWTGQLDISAMVPTYLQQPAWCANLRVVAIHQRGNNRSCAEHHGSAPNPNQNPDGSGRYHGSHSYLSTWVNPAWTNCSIGPKWFTMKLIY